jgi:CheY-like chemotaxis protein
MKQILIVEDEMIVAMVLKKCVEEMGHQVTAIVKNGEKAVCAVKDNQPDLILMDLKLKGTMDGISTMLEIRKFSDIPLIYTTGNSDNIAKKRAEDTNFSSFLVKPISCEELKKAIEKVLLF